MTTARSRRPSPRPGDPDSVMHLEASRAADLLSFDRGADSDAAPTRDGIYSQNRRDPGGSEMSTAQSTTEVCQDQVPVLGVNSNGSPR